MEARTTVYTTPRSWHCTLQPALHLRPQVKLGSSHQNLKPAQWQRNRMKSRRKRYVEKHWALMMFWLTKCQFERNYENVRPVVPSKLPNSEYPLIDNDPYVFQSLLQTTCSDPTTQQALQTSHPLHATSRRHTRSRRGIPWSPRNALV